MNVITDEWEIIDSPYVSSIFGHKVYNEKMDIELSTILHSPSLSPKTWYRLTATLRDIGYTIEEQYAIIDKENRWKKYDRQETITQLRYVYKQRKHNIDRGADNSILSSAPPFTTDIDIIKLFLDTCEPWHVSPPSSIKAAAHYYHCTGACPIPMRADVKRPAYKWKEYQERQPTLKEMAAWNWDNGLLLLGDKERCYLDIDVYSPTHPGGLQNFNEEILDGWTWERTPSGGYHVLGYGHLKTVYGQAVEIRGKGAYIVSAPTKGYVVV